MTNATVPRAATAPPYDAAAVRAVAAAADARTAQLDTLRQIPFDLHEQAADAGLFRQLVPAAFGGQQRTPLEWFRTGVELARHEASLGWVVTQGAVELGWIAAGGDPDWAAEVLADLRGTSASTIAGRGRIDVAGARVRFAGRWSFNTGCTAATWIGGLAIVTRDGRPRDPFELRWGWVPADRAEIVDDWDTSGLRGTGSHTTVIAEQDIPWEWTFDPFTPTAHDRGAYRCLVGNGNWPIASSVAATQLGNARRALDEATAIALTKAPPPEFVALAEHPGVQRAIGEAEGLWAAALASVERELEALWDEAGRLGELTADQRVRLHRANTTANQLAVRVVDIACEVTGTSGIARDHVLNRCRRDAQALHGHVGATPAGFERSTRVALGKIPSDLRV